MSVTQWWPIICLLPDMSCIHFRKYEFLMGPNSVITCCKSCRNFDEQLWFMWSEEILDTSYLLTKWNLTNDLLNSARLWFSVLYISSLSFLLVSLSPIWLKQSIYTLPIAWLFTTSNLLSLFSDVLIPFLCRNIYLRYFYYSYRKNICPQTVDCTSRWLWWIM